MSDPLSSLILKAANYIGLFGGALTMWTVTSLQGTWLYPKTGSWYVFITKSKIDKRQGLQNQHGIEPQALLQCRASMWNHTPRNKWIRLLISLISLGTPKCNEPRGHEENITWNVESKGRRKNFFSPTMYM